MDLDKFLKRKLITKINEEELERYLSFFSITYKENLDHSKLNLLKFPRWSMISGYYDN